MLADYHVHTHYSSDSKYRMEKVVQDAIKKGIDELCFTDHVDYGVKEDQDSKKEIRFIQGIPLINVDYPKYMQEISQLKEIYKDKIKIKTGMEFGIQTHTIAQFENLFKKYDFDFIILSIHQIENKELWNQDFQRNKPQREVYEKYYQELLEVIRNYKNYSVLGHLDLISRYEIQDAYPFEKVKEIIKEILKVVIHDRKGIELNTSYHRYGLPDTIPSIDILKLYHDLGGKILTIGSDSHKPADLGAYIEEDKQLLKKIGFKEYCTYDQMKPIFHKL